MRWLLFCVMLVPACQARANSRQNAPIGSPCSDDADCGTGRFACAADHPGGYCIAQCKNAADCPAGSTCVGASALASGACHVLCNNAANCRTGYLCSASDEDHAHCDAPGPRSLYRRIRSRAWR